MKALKGARLTMLRVWRDPAYRGERSIRDGQGVNGDLLLELDTGLSFRITVRRTDGAHYGFCFDNGIPGASDAVMSMPAQRVSEIGARASAAVDKVATTMERAGVDIPFLIYPEQAQDDGTFRPVLGSARDIARLAPSLDKPLTFNREVQPTT